MLRELPTHVEQARQLVERVMVPANRLLAAYLEARVDPARAEKLSLIISGRGLLGMLLFVFLTTISPTHATHCFTGVTPDVLTHACSSRIHSATYQSAVCRK